MSVPKEIASNSTLQAALPAQSSLHRPTAHDLPAEPLVTIEPSRSWVAVDLGSVWAYRELLFFLAWRDIKVRYKQTALGVLWVVIQPLLMTMIFTVFLGMLARVPGEGGVAYPLFIYLGLLPWTFFSNAVVTSAGSLLTNAHLITKVYFPRMIVPAATVGARLIDFSIGFVLLAGLMLYYGVAPTSAALMLLPLSLLVIALALGFGLLIAALNVKYRDASLVLPVLMQLWMFVSPVLYSLGLVPERWRRIYSLNPLVGIIDGFRAAILGRTFDWTALSVSAAAAVVLLVFSAFLFRRVERGFADSI